ncbi:hypothetical protein BD626DRAFT_367403, partial [Schizophyllum amplum]
GRLAMLPYMPLDIIYEIFQALRPCDLLQMSRVSKMLRGILMSKSSGWIWRYSYSATGLPPVPDEMTIPGFVSLIYDNQCHV